MVFLCKYWRRRLGTRTERWEPSGDENLTAKADEYLKRAKECQREADQAMNAADKEKWLRKAQSWIWLHRYERAQRAAEAGESNGRER